MAERGSTAVIQYKPGDFADLKAKHGDHWNYLGIGGGLLVGTNGPRGMPPQLWINFFATVFCVRAGLIAAWTTLVNVMRWLLGCLNPEADTEPLRWPSLQLILEILKASPTEIWSSKGDYARSLIQPLEGMIAAIGDTVNVFGGIDIEEHFVRQGKSLAIDLSNISPPWIRLLLTDLLLGSLLLGRMARHHRVDQTEVVVIIDECDAYVSRQSVSAFEDGMAVVDQLLKFSREHGIAVIIALSDLGNASRMVLNNVQNHITFKLSHELSITEASRTLSLPPGGGATYHGLRPGECIVRCDGPWPHAMLGKIDYVAPARAAPPIQYDRHPFIPGKPLAQLSEIYVPLKTLIDRHKQRKLQQQTSKSASAKKDGSICAMAQRLLSEAATHPWDLAVELWRLMPETPHFEAQKRIYKELTDAKLAVVDCVRIGRTTYALIEPTELGYRHLKIEPPHFRGGGKLTHRTFIHWLATVGRKRGYRVEIEWSVPETNHAVDCAWLLEENRWLAWEVMVTCEGNIPSHIRACLEQSEAVTEVRIAVAQKTIAKHLERDLRAMPGMDAYLDRVSVEPIEPYMKEALS